MHRDLKPANIKVRDDGTVKVLDFGLAKLNEPNVSNASTRVLSLSPTITSPVLMTGVGVLLGTAAYMSPEQARGKAVDKRADIWAFGCVLYFDTHSRPINTLAWRYDVTPDGKRFLLALPVGASAGPPPLNVVVNWDAELKK